MQIILQGNEEKIKMELVLKKVRKRTSNIEKIKGFVSQLPNNPYLVKINAKEIEIIYRSKDRLIFRDYKKLFNNEVFKIVFDNIKDGTPIVRNVKNVNKTKIAALALSSVILLSVVVPKVKKTVPSITNQTSISYETVPLSNKNEYKIIMEDSNLKQQSELNDFVSLDNYQLEKRLEQTIKIINGEIKNNPDISLATKNSSFALDKIVNFINSENGQFCFEECYNFGIDPYTFICIMMTESSLDHYATIPSGENYNGFGVGLCQLESPNGQEIKAFNYITNEEEIIYETMENAIDINCNIKMGIMRYQNSINRYKGNEKIAIQSHNYGQGLMDLIISIYAQEKGISVDDVLYNYNDIGWLKYIKEVHMDPVSFAKKYANFTEHSATLNLLKTWQYGTYGNDHYLEDVYSYYIGIYSKNIVNGEIIETNLINNSITKNNFERNDMKSLRN